MPQAREHSLGRWQPFLKEEEVQVFSDETVAAAWRRSGGRCECRDPDHGHELLRCHSRLAPEGNQPPSHSPGWRAIPLIPGHPVPDPSLANCRLLCPACLSRSSPPRGSLAEDLP